MCDMARRLRVRAVWREFKALARIQSCVQKDYRAVCRQIVGLCADRIQGCVQTDCRALWRDCRALWRDCRALWRDCREHAAV